MSVESSGPRPRLLLQLVLVSASSCLLFPGSFRCPLSTPGGRWQPAPTLPPRTTVHHTMGKLLGLDTHTCVDPGNKTILLYISTHTYIRVHWAHLATVTCDV